MLKNILNFDDEKDMIRWLRIMTDCMFIEKRSIRIVHCSEFSHLTVKVFIRLIVELVIYHKNESCRIESYQYKSGQIYRIKIEGNNERRFTNRSVKVKEIEILRIREKGISVSKLIEFFQLKFSIKKSLK
jgi:hypothetical protein